MVSSWNVNKFSIWQIFLNILIGGSTGFCFDSSPSLNRHNKMLVMFPNLSTSKIWSWVYFDHFYKCLIVSKKGIVHFKLQMKTAYAYNIRKRLSYLSVSLFLRMCVCVCNSHTYRYTHTHMYIYYTGKHGIQKNKMKWARKFSHFPGICGVVPYENHMTAGRLACQFKHVQLDLTELSVCQFITGTLIKF